MTCIICSLGFTKKLCVQSNKLDSASFHCSSVWILHVLQKKKFVQTVSRNLFSVSLEAVIFLSFHVLQKKKITSM